MKWNLAILLLLVFAVGRAQTNRFIYIQSDDKQPFYVKMDNRLLSSSPSGYLIIPRLAEGHYDISVGFPKNEWPEQHASCTVGKKDMGYQLRHFGTKGWGLYNLQSMETTMLSGEKPAPKPEVKESNDAFANMLSNVVNDPSIRQVDNSHEQTKPAADTTTKSPETPVIKLNQEHVAGGERIVYVDNASKDTVQLVIPGGTANPKEETVIGKLVPADKQEVKPVDETGVPEKKRTAELKTETPSPALILVKSDVKTITNMDCKKMATENDFILLRKKMIGENDDDGMIDVARRAFKQKCYSTEQVKNLAVLFLKEGYRYTLFDTAYPFVSDRQNFPALQSLLADAYFINRFKALTSPR